MAEFKHKMIKDVVYEALQTTKTDVQLRESTTGRVFWISKAELSKSYTPHR